jgi:hypothetical protein
MIRGLAVQSLGGTRIVEGITAYEEFSIPTAREYFSPRLNYFLCLCPGVKLAAIRITAFMKSHSNIVKVYNKIKVTFILL